MNSFDIFITDQAESDLDGIVTYLQTNWSERIKTDFLAAVSQKMQLVSTMPFMYRSSSVEAGIREGFINRFVTAYRSCRLSRTAVYTSCLSGIIGRTGKPLLFTHRTD